MWQFYLLCILLPLSSAQETFDGDAYLNFDNLRLKDLSYDCLDNAKESSVHFDRAMKHDFNVTSLLTKILNQRERHMDNITQEMMYQFQNGNTYLFEELRSYFDKVKDISDTQLKECEENAEEQIKQYYTNIIDIFNQHIGKLRETICNSQSPENDGTYREHSTAVKLMQNLTDSLNNLKDTTEHKITNPFYSHLEWIEDAVRNCKKIISES